ncbi:aryl-alcohol dehydrogenase-like predicted oxidoreductase [Edaphobacter lichenicola]|uniref:Aryl-alcohol dehydrogenase-like predicted oxidoreductase n=1 Tax=Tunturiibacter gelidiferens TaxID=3069689 RepID=A0ACC5NWY7_9BACT|nr:aldo/keto reductase [Edaphobacter lichenicola]MBB5338975.1 aryl-alcohol dehydrogenase-like predicted oxidoreductase [Edaphobacter lichenicola]
MEGLRHGVVLATKCGRYGLEEFDFSARGVTERFEDSLRRLRTDYVDLLQVHDIEFGNIQQIISETLPALRRLQEQGKARFVGITGYWPSVLTHVARLEPVDTILNYCHANLMMNDMDRALTPFVRESGVGLLNASPMHMCLLAGFDVPEWHPAPNNVKLAAAKVVAICHYAGVAPSAVAVNACLSHPVAASTLVGMSSEAQVDENCAALDFQPSEELIRVLNETIAPIFNTTWPQGRPENEHFGSRDSFQASSRPRAKRETTVFERIDAHHHLWSYRPSEFGWIDDAMQPLRRDFLPAELEAQAARAHVESTVVVQARQTLDETTWLLELFDTHNFISGVVGWLPIANSTFPALLDAFAEQPGLKGLRHVVQASRSMETLALRLLLPSFYYKATIKKSHSYQHCQSHGRTALSGACARGGLEVALRWKDGKLVDTELLALRDGTHRLRVQRGLRLIRATNAKGDTVDLTPDKDGEIVTMRVRKGQ